MSHKLAKPVDCEGYVRFRNCEIHMPSNKPVDCEGYIRFTNCEIHMPSNESSDKEMAPTVLHHLHH